MKLLLPDVAAETLQGVNSPPASSCPAKPTAPPSLSRETTCPLVMPPVSPAQTTLLSGSGWHCSIVSCLLRQPLTWRELEALPCGPRVLAHPLSALVHSRVISPPSIPPFCSTLAATQGTEGAFYFLCNLPQGGASARVIVEHGPAN